MSELQIFELVKSIRTMVRLFSQPALPARGISKDPTLWLDGAKPLLKYVFKNKSEFAELTNLTNPYNTCKLQQKSLAAPTS